MVKAVLGRVYPGHKTAKTDNYGYTIDELKELAQSKKLIGKPIWLEHREPAIGKIKRAWVDQKGFLCVWADLFDAEHLEDEKLYESIQTGIRDEELSFFSIHWIGQRDSSGRVIQDSKTFLEASLTTEPAYAGTSVFSQAASKDSNVQVIAHGHGKITMNTEEIQAMFTENGVGHIDAASLGGMGAAQIAALMNAEIAKARDTAAQETEAKLAPQATMTDTERSELDQFRKREEVRQKMHKEEAEKYAEREKKNVEPVFEGIKHLVPEEQHETFKSDLAGMASEISGQTFWNAFKMYEQRTTAQQKDIEERIKTNSKLTKDNSVLMKELREAKMQVGAAEIAANQTVEQSASKRNANIGFNPGTEKKRQKVEETASAKEKTTPVDEQASMLQSQEQTWFSKAFAVPRGYDMENETSRNFLAFIHEKQHGMVLGAGQPLYVENDYKGDKKAYLTMPMNTNY